MTINIEYETDKPLDVDYEKVANDIIPAALDYEKCPYEAEVNLILTDNDAIQEINRDYRQIDRPTDVLSFPMIDFEKESDFSHVEEAVEDYFNPETGELILGDIIVSVEKVIEQAEKYGHSRERELAFLIAHSMLHLCGYDHMEDAEREVMETRQREILAGEGYHRWRKNKGKKYAFGIMAAWCLAVGAAALTGCGAKEADNKITVESASEAPETKPIEIETEAPETEAPQTEAADPDEQEPRVEKDGMIRSYLDGRDGAGLPGQPPSVGHYDEQRQGCSAAVRHQPGRSGL